MIYGKGDILSEEFLAALRKEFPDETVHLIPADWPEAKAAGYRGYHRGMALEDNPYDDAWGEQPLMFPNARHDQWADGWHAAEHQDTKEL